MFLLNTAQTQGIIALLIASTTDASTLRALARLQEYLNAAPVAFEIDQDSLIVKSAHSEDFYESTMDACTCPCGKSRHAALEHVKRFGPKGIKINMCWHMQLAHVVAVAFRLSDMLGGLSAVVVDADSPAVLDLAPVAVAA